MKNKIFILVYVIIMHINLFSQKKSEYGGWLPVNNTIRVLLIFAEIDCSACNPNSCGSDNPSSWLPNNLPFNKDLWFDASLSTGQQPTPGTLTDYYYQMSMGQYIVLGDYYPSIITVPCTSNNPTAEIFNIINTNTLTIGSFLSSKSLTLSNFDLWSDEGSEGIAKNPSQNNIIDITAIIWRNTGGSACQGGGIGINNFTLKQNASQNYQTKVVTGFKSCDSNPFTFAGEYFHAMFGGNHWHSGGGAGGHTFLVYPQNNSMTSYSFVGQLANGFDRNHMGWNGWKTNVGGTRKQFLISAKTISQAEVNTALDITSTFPDGNEFILRDFGTQGQNDYCCWKTKKD